VAQKPQIAQKKQAIPRSPTMEKQWWNLTGDMLYKYGKKAFNYAKTALSGFGDYEVETNSLLAAATHGMNGNKVPIMENSKVVNIIRHREYIGDIYGSTSNFKLRKFAINPGLEETFPWLSPIAQSYTNYRLRGAMFEFVSLSTEYSAQPYIGFVAMASNYNALSPDFENKKEMENSEYASSAKTSESFCHPVECKKSMISNDELYIRKDNQPGTGDLRLYDLGNFFIAVGGQATETIIGELWLTYEVEFFFPVLARGGSASLTDSIRLLISSSVAFGTNTPLCDGNRSINIIKNTTNMVLKDNYAIDGGNMSYTGLTFTPECFGKDYDVVLHWDAQTAVAITFPTTNLQNTGAVAPYNGSTAASMTMFGTFSPSQSNQTLAITAGTGTFPGGTPVTVSVIITETARL
jgi:hypothetical protein